MASLVEDFFCAVGTCLVVMLVVSACHVWKLMSRNLELDENGEVVFYFRQCGAWLQESLPHQFLSFKMFLIVWFSNTLAWFETLHSFSHWLMTGIFGIQIGRMWVLNWVQIRFGLIFQFLQRMLEHIYYYYYVCSGLLHNFWGRLASYDGGRLKKLWNMYVLIISQ